MESFVNKISKPQIISSKNITSTKPDLLDMPNQGEFVKMAPLPTFQGSYTNFIKKDRRLTFNSKFREILILVFLKWIFLEQNHLLKKL